ncbi:MAG TPA: PASTA domain-containing protein [Gaiellaceae bacterium]|jgi:hypothetical protein|nr:PASTA domain-containing protein [Gaiellaceae bacterium]
MTARLAAMLPRLFALTLIGLLTATSLTFASATRKLEKNESEAAAVQAGPKTLRVPDVRGQAYVFAKGILEDAGFSWQVVGPVEGYAANLVAVQSPAPGIEVLDNGAPTIELRLERNPDYAERGLPENTSSFEGTELRLASDPQPEAEEEKPAPPAEEEQAARKEEEPEPKDEEQPGEAGREPDFPVPGAPAEPAEEMPLPDRARLVEQRVGAARKPTPELVDWWLYQHSWIVTGARFGWHDGAEALRILIRVDRSIEARWGFGAKSTRVAERALAEVESKAGT